MTEFSRYEPIEGYVMSSIQSPPTTITVFEGKRVTVDFFRIASQAPVVESEVVASADPPPLAAPHLDQDPPDGDGHAT